MYIYTHRAEVVVEPGDLVAHHGPEGVAPQAPREALAAERPRIGLGEGKNIILHYIILYIYIYIYIYE